MINENDVEEDDFGDGGFDENPPSELEDNDLEINSLQNDLNQNQDNIEEEIQHVTSSKNSETHKNNLNNTFDSKQKKVTEEQEKIENNNNVHINNNKQTDIKPKTVLTELMKNYITEIESKDKILVQLEKINSELKTKIENYDLKFKNFENKIKEQKEQNKEYAYNSSIKEIINKINQLNKQSKEYKNKYEQIKNKLNVLQHVEDKMKSTEILKNEEQKNMELKNIYNNLKNENAIIVSQLKRRANEFRNEEKISFLQNEVKGAKSKYRSEQETYFKRDNFLKIIHDKIFTIEKSIKYLNDKKKAMRNSEKLFSFDDLKTALNTLWNLRKQIDFNTERLEKSNIDINTKIHICLTRNKQIEDNFKALLIKNNILQKERITARHKIYIIDKKLVLTKSLTIKNMNSINSRYRMVNNNDNNALIKRNKSVDLRKNKNTLFPINLTKKIY